MPLTVTNEQIAAAYDHCERIASRDKPHLYAAAQLFGWESTRRAFAATYASMRLIDDFIDNIPERAAMAPTSREAAARHLDTWLRLIHSAQNGDGVGSDPVALALRDTFGCFDLPITPWDNLARAMESDLSTSMFRDWDHLRTYMTGASVAPAIVFTHLVLMRPDAAGERFVCPWAYERVAAATEDLAIFCYWVHILRDVAADLAAGGCGLVYIPEADLRAFGLEVGDLHQMRTSEAASPAYVLLAEFEADRAREHLQRGRAHLPSLLDAAPTVNRAALVKLVDTYAALLQELAERHFDVFSKEMSTRSGH